MTRIVVYLAAILFVNVTSASNILYLSPMASKSHHIWNKVLAIELAEKGHNVTYLSPYNERESVANITFYFCPEVLETIGDNFDFIDIAKNADPLDIINLSLDWDELHCNAYLKSKILQVLLNYPKNFKFDLIIQDLTSGPCLLPLIHQFNYPPSVAVTPFLLPSYIYYDFDKDLMKSLYVPWYGGKSGVEMNFYQRLQSFVFNHLDVFYRWYFEEPKTEKLHKEVFGDDIPPFSVLKRHFSLLLANTDPVLDYPQTLPPNIIPVGGLHIGRKQELIPNELLKILDNAKEGVILFSLGTNVKSSQLTKEIIDSLLVAFKQLKQVVVWKYEGDLENLPKNVIIQKWLPQTAILSHPNTKLFLGHGGALSTQEAIYYCVKIIAIPFFIDQNTNTQLLVDRKLGEKIDFQLITPEYVLEKINKVLHDPIYSKNIKERSKHFRDKPQTPLQTAIFWIDYILRHGHAKFLETSTRNMPFSNSSGLDVMTFFLILLSSAFYLTFKSLYLIQRIFTKKHKAKTA